MRRAPLVTLLTVLVAASVTSCAVIPGGPTASPASRYRACMVSGVGGFADKSFNQIAQQGLQNARDRLGVQIAQVASADVNDFVPNIQTMVDAGCDLIITVSYQMADVTVDAARANPTIDFAVVDSAVGDTGLANVKPLLFNTAESALLAGYLAASLTKTGSVGTFAGARTPAVTLFLDGFVQGVTHYNVRHRTAVTVLGWDLASQDGLFVPGTKPFENVAGAAQLASALISDGADVLFPVAGQAGQGALQVATSSGSQVAVIWVDMDGCVSIASYCPVIPTSVVKNLDAAVVDVISSAVQGGFTPEPYVGTLTNGGTGLAPFHTFDSTIPAATKAELDELRAGIIDGTIMIESPSLPA